MTKLSLACGLALSVALTACSSVPKEASTATASTSGTAAPATGSTTPKLVCDDSDQMGSHFKQHICLTPEQVEQRRKDSQQAAQDLQQRAQPLNSSGKPPI